MREADDARAVAVVLRQHGVGCVFGGAEPPDAPLPGGLEEAGIPVVRTLHQQTAVFAADAWARVSRGPGVALVAGRAGLPNAVTGIANAHASGSPVVVVDDRRELSGGGPFDRVDHRAMVRTVNKAATTVGPAGLPAALSWACEAANRAPRGPVLVEILDPEGPATGRAGPSSGALTANRADEGDRRAGPAPATGPDLDASEPDKAAMEEIAELLRRAERPVVVAGGNVYWAGAEAALRRFAEGLGVPVVMNGMGRGTLPADHDLALSRARPSALRGADLVVVAGTPLDFRLGYGRFGAARVVHLCDDASQIATQAEIAAAVAGDLGLILDELTERAAPNGDTTAWTEQLRVEEADLRRSEEAEFERAERAEALDGETRAAPLRAPRLYRELRRWLDRDAIVIGDGGDFVSYAGRFVDTFTPGCFLDPGPFGCLGIGLGFAMGARLARPGRQVVVLLGDGAAGFSLMELETLVRHGLPAVLIVGNNDGNHGELVREAAELGPALERAFSAGTAALVNVALDPADAYPRSTALA